jgi:hypothetical protein
VLDRAPAEYNAVITSEHKNKPDLKLIHLAEVMNPHWGTMSPDIPTRDGNKEMELTAVRGKYFHCERWVIERMTEGSRETVRVWFRRKMEARGMEKVLMTEIQVQGEISMGNATTVEKVAAGQFWLLEENKDKRPKIRKERGDETATAALKHCYLGF